MDFLRKFDAFPKALDDYRVRTSSGALISIVALCLMIVLFLSELNYFTNVETIDYLYVNSTRSQNLHVSFDLSFPEVPCNLLSIDAVDDMGMVQEDVVSEIYKHRLDNNGDQVGEKMPHILGNSIRTEEELKELSKLPHADDKYNECGNCYGAAKPGICCNSCQDVRDAYSQMGWLFKPQEILQCRSEAVLETLKDKNAESGGCEIYGHLELTKTSGHFHIAPHKNVHDSNKEQGEGFSLLDLLEFTFAQFNITHKIHSLSFGDNFPGFKSPLDGQLRTIQDTHGMYQYYIKIVPTKYKKIGDHNNEIESNQYAVTEHLRHLAPGSGRGLPGVYFNYEISPVQAVFEETSGKFLRFVTSLCAILGGLYTVMGLLDGLISTATSYKDMQL
jgi:endoplasmic reticulum-Golgi intermediate compartment protein 3